MIFSRNRDIFSLSKPYTVQSSLVRSAPIEAQGWHKNIFIIFFIWLLACVAYTGIVQNILRIIYKLHIIFNPPWTTDFVSLLYSMYKNKLANNDDFCVMLITNQLSTENPINLKPFIWHNWGIADPFILVYRINRTTKRFYWGNYVIINVPCQSNT